MYDLIQLIEINFISGVIVVIFNILSIPLDYRYAKWAYFEIWNPLKYNIKYMFKHPIRFWITGKYNYKSKNKFITVYIDKSNIKTYV